MCAPKNESESARANETLKLESADCIERDLDFVCPTAAAAAPAPANTRPFARSKQASRRCGHKARRLLIDAFSGQLSASRASRRRHNLGGFGRAARRGANVNRNQQQPPRSMEDNQTGGHSDTEPKPDAASPSSATWRQRLERRASSWRRADMAVIYFESSAFFFFFEAQVEPGQLRLSAAWPRHEAARRSNRILPRAPMRCTRAKTTTTTTAG